MRSLSFLICFVGIIFLLVGCNGKSKNQEGQFEVVKIKGSEYSIANLSDFVENPEMIKLETNDTCLISGITHLEVTTKYVFISDRANLFQFDRKGKFIRKIGRQGHGPHEHQGILCFTVSSNDERIFIGTLGKIFCFDFNGGFIEEIVDYKLFDCIYACNDELWAFFTEIAKSNDGKFENRTKVNQYSLKGGILKNSILLKSIKHDAQEVNLVRNIQYVSETSTQRYIYTPVYFEPISRDTLYRIKDSLLIPDIKLDFSDLAVINGKAKNIQIVNINRNERYLFAEYAYKSRSRLFIYDFSNDKQYNLTEGFNDNVFGTGNAMLRPVDSKFDLMYFKKEGYELVGKVEGVTENSNPVIFMVEFKK